MKSIAMHGLSAIDEVDLKIIQLADEMMPNHAVKLLALSGSLNKIREKLAEFNNINEESVMESINKEYEHFVIKYNLPNLDVFKQAFIESHIEKNKYVKELEGHLSGDPNLVADEASKINWRHSAIAYADKLEKKIKKLEEKLNNL